MIEISENEFFNRSEAKLKPIVTWLRCGFPRLAPVARFQREF